MASIITSTSAHFALEHHGSGSWSRLYHGDSPHGSQHLRHLQEIHAHTSHNRHHHRRSHSDQGIDCAGRDDHHHHHHHHHHQLGNHLCPWPWGQGHLHHRSHSDYLVHKHKHSGSHSGLSENDNSRSSSVKGFDVRAFTSDIVEGYGHYHGNKESGYQQVQGLRGGYSHRNGHYAVHQVDYTFKFLYNFLFSSDWLRIIVNLEMFART